MKILKNILTGTIILLTLCFYGIDNVKAVEQSNTNACMQKCIGNVVNKGESDNSTSVGIVDTVNKTMCIMQCTLETTVATANIAPKTIDCGQDIIGIPVETAKIMRTIYLLIKIFAPLVLVFMGMLDFGKAVIGSSEDDIKKKQNKFIKRLIAAAVLFLVMAIVELVFSLLAKAGFADATACINAILNGDF